jgi:hypothetical protein
MHTTSRKASTLDFRDLLFILISSYIAHEYRRYAGTSARIYMIRYPVAECDNNTLLIIAKIGGAVKGFL